MSLSPADSPTTRENRLHGDQLVVQHKDSSEQLQPTSSAEQESRDSCRLKRYRKEVAGRVWIPEIWGQEELLKDWVDCSVFDTALAPPGIVSARTALAEDGAQLLRRGAMLPHN